MLSTRLPVRMYRACEHVYLDVIEIRCECELAISCGRHTRRNFGRVWTSVFQTQVRSA